MSKKKITLSVACLTVHQFIDALNHRMKEDDGVRTECKKFGTQSKQIQIDSIERTDAQKFTIKGHILVSSGWVPFVGKFEGDPWVTLKGKITYEEK